MPLNLASIKQTVANAVRSTFSLRVSDHHRQSLESAQVECWPVPHFVGCQPPSWESAQERAESGLGFESRQRGSQTEVRALSEAHMMVVFPRDVQLIGIGKAGRVAVGSSQHQVDELAPADHLAID